MILNNYQKHWQVSSYKNLWQHPVWENFQKKIGRKTWQVTTSGASALVIKHHLPKGLSWLEVPRGPLFEDEKCLQEILEKIRIIGKKEKSIFVRFSPYEAFQLSTFNFQLSKFDHHPETSLVLDLNQSEEELLRQMKPKGRYNIKVAQKHEVTVKKSTDIDAFYQLLIGTGNRDNFGIHSKSYYQNMLQQLGQHGQLFLAEHQGKIIAGGIFVYLEDHAIYYYGASSHDHRKYMAPYLVQWEAIKEGKNRRCKTYDFLGISPEKAINHPWKGVTQFKKRFGGTIVNYPTAKELVLRPFLYRLYQAYKKLK